MKLEEALAEDFRIYMQRNESIFGKIFSTIKEVIKALFGKRTDIDKLFFDISRGRLANREVQDSTNTLARQEEYTDEMKSILAEAPRDSNGRLLAPNGKVSNLNERQYAQVRTKAFKNWFGDWELISSFNYAKFINNKDYERTDEFIRVQEESNRLLQKDISDFHRGNRELTEDSRQILADTYGRLLSRNSGARSKEWITVKDTRKHGNSFEITLVSGKLFHDIFEINRKYLPNGELVDLHDDYSNCKCFLSSNGMQGFAIEPDGNIVSVFSLNPTNIATERGFLYAVSDFIKEQGGTHLDAYVSPTQNLEGIYKKVFGFSTASTMEYNMEFDHDDIAKNHSNPNIVFMVSSNAKNKHFTKDEYDDATANQNTYIPKVEASKVVDENGEPLVVYHGSSTGDR